MNISHSLEYLLHKRFDLTNRNPSTQRIYVCARNIWRDLIWILPNILSSFFGILDDFFKILIAIFKN
jgi:hypothetical protein